MMTKGYMRKNEDVKVLHYNFRRLVKAGIPHSSITIGGDIVQVIDSLSCGDCLVVPSVAELSPQTTRQQILLKRMADNGVIFCPLNSIDTTSKIATENFMDRLLRYLGISHSRMNHSVVKPKSPIDGDSKIRIINDCLKLYYGLKESVETICDKAQIQPRALYDFLRKHNLPSRREVKAKPKLNPLRRRGFPENLLAKISTDETK